MKRLLVALSIALGAQVVLAHDMFLVLDDHDQPADSQVTIALYNGTFDKSENSIERSRMIDVSVVDSEGAISHPLAGQWRDENDMSLLTFETGSAGSYLVGVSTKARNIELSADDFNEYLRHDGVLDTLAAREEAGILGLDAVERYSKHVKSIVQVGGAGGDAWRQPLGYPIEIVPESNPADLCPGDELGFRVLADGAPVAGQLVYASHAGFHGHSDDGSHREAVTTRTDAEGTASVAIDTAGRWYLRLIRMLPVDEDEVDYESNWATLTFEVDCAD